MYSNAATLLIHSVYALKLSACFKGKVCPPLAVVTGDAADLDSTHVELCCSATHKLLKGSGVSKQTRLPECGRLLCYLLTFLSYLSLQVQCPRQGQRRRSRSPAKCLYPNDRQSECRLMLVIGVDLGHLLVSVSAILLVNHQRTTNFYL